MDRSTIKQQASKYKTARANLLVVVICTAANLFLAAFNANLYLLFSATAPLLFFEIGRGLALEFQSDGFVIAGLIIAFVVIILYFVCWLLAKRRRVFILAALLLFVLDSLIFVYLILSSGFEADYFLDIVFHIWILYFLINGTIAWAKLRGVFADDLDALIQEPTTTAVLTQTGIAQPSNDETASPLKNWRVPLRTDDKKGRILITAEYGGLQISLKRTRGLTELIVDGYVYDEITGIIEVSYSLVANVQNTKIAGIFNAKTSHMYLYANDELIAKKLRFY